MAYECLTQLWADKVKNGDVTIDEVPKFLQEKVKATLNN